jgi:glycosyltransferase involved in cell wall biosynthesis
MKVLWLASWYPNPINATNGDFVQRHAEATALLCKVDIIHVEATTANTLNQKTFIKITQQNKFSETIVLFNKPPLPILGKIIAHRKYLKLFKQQVQNYISKNGKPDLVHVHVAMKAGLIALWMKKKFGINYLVTEHSTMFTGNAPDAYKNRNTLYKTLTGNIFKNASLVLPVSRDLGEAINAIIPIRFTVIYNCVNTNYFFYNDSSQAKNFTFIHVSTLNNKKNPQDIIQAFIYFNQKYPDSKLIVVGLISPELTKYLSRLNFSISVIQFTGFVPYENVAQLMQQSNCFILFSREENMPCVVLEALCCGLPVISSNVGGVGEVINSKNGLLVPEYTVESLLETMMKLYNNYRFYNRGKNSEEAKKNFSYDVIAKEIFVKYNEVLNIT